MTITVAQMIEALSRLPQDAELVVTESGYYSYREFADIMLPEAYTVEGVDEDADVGKVVTIEEDYDLYDEDTGETETKVRRVVYRIGHSHQSY
jgi:hypothetical protein